jgi:hypothetical protein
VGFYDTKLIFLNIVGEEENNTNYFSSNNTIVKDNRCESILKENPNPLRLSFLNQKQDNKEFLKFQQQQNNIAKPNDNFLLNDYLPNNIKSGYSATAEADINKQKLYKHSYKCHSKYSKSSKNILIDLNEDDCDVNMINPNYDSSETLDNSERCDGHNRNEHNHDHGHGHSHDHGHNHEHGHTHNHKKEVSITMNNESKGEHCHGFKKIQERNKRVWYKLITVLALCVFFMIGEIIGGIIARSISIQTGTL